MREYIYRYIDFDGVIYNSNEIIDNILLESGINIKDQTQVTALIRKIDFYHMIKNAKQINNSLADLEQLCQDPRYKTIILTHVNSEKEALDKARIIKEELSCYIKIIPVPKIISKSHYVNPQGAILVDDYKNNLRCWAIHRGYPIHFDPALKPSEFPVINRLFDLDKTIETNYPKILQKSIRS